MSKIKTLTNIFSKQIDEVLSYVYPVGSVILDKLYLSNLIDKLTLYYKNNISPTTTILISIILVLMLLFFIFWDSKN